MTNIYPTDITRKLLNSKERTYISEVRRAAFGVCRTNISESYIHASFNKFKEGFVYIRDNAVMAFCIWKIKTGLSKTNAYRPHMVIYLVCSTQQPFNVLDMILYDVEQYCREKGVSIISLEPDNDTLREYYRTKGFAERDYYNPANMVKEVDTPFVYQKQQSSEDVISLL
jgi:hypothetical protein